MLIYERMHIILWIYLILHTVYSTSQTSTIKKMKEIHDKIERKCNTYKPSIQSLFCRTRYETNKNEERENKTRM